MVTLMSKKLNEAARLLGRKGGLKAAQRLTPEQRRERGIRGMQSRWADHIPLRDPDLIAPRKRGKAAQPGGVLSGDSSSEAREA